MTCVPSILVHDYVCVGMGSVTVLCIGIVASEAYLSN
jgi:hypothetical protein